MICFYKNAAGTFGGGRNILESPCRCLLRKIKNHHLMVVVD
jgi:hypothetical protein